LSSRSKGKGHGNRFAQLDQKILEVLAQGPLSTQRLAERVGQSEALLLERCRALRRSGRLRSLDVDGLDVAILTRLAQQKTAPLTTAALQQALTPADGSRARREQVYRRCVRLAGKADLLRSEKVKSERQLYFFPATGEVLNKNNYAGVHEALAGLRAIAAGLPVPRGANIPPAVKAELRRNIWPSTNVIRCSVPRSCRPCSGCWESPCSPRTSTSSS
jgi:DNA-binding Lrp family transcriptional regulator